MSDRMQKNLTPTQREYQRFAKKREPDRPLLTNCLRAFFSGGLICLLGQAISLFYTTFFDFTERTASDPTAATLIFFAALLTGLGIYDHIAQWAGAGTAVPVTGFSNAIASAAIEHRSEGFILGVGGNMFKLAGPVIVYGVVAAFFVALIRYTIIYLGG
jgi:stage V sporulation protein AC